jgi:tetratricopeptide (TPR) repeat protein
MRNWLPLSLCALLAACATPQPVAPPPSSLFDDSLFAAPSERISDDDIFAVNEPMRQYLARPEVVAQLRRKGLQRGLLDALYEKGELKIDYDGSMTRTAAQAFDARAGNCLSLVVMTAALARELGLNVRFRAAVADEVVSRNSNLLLRSGHVNVTLSRRFAEPNRPEYDALTIDFLPPEEVKGLRTREISEDRVVAMFMNNRAVEAMVGGRLDDAYAWARESVRRDPNFLGALNTLGVVYLRRGSLTQASRVFIHVLDRDAENRAALANLAGAYWRMGRSEESTSLQRRLALLEPEPPLHFFHLGLAAMKKQDFKAAREHFGRELKRADGNHELHYWLALANLQLGDEEQARQYLAKALQAGPTRTDRDLYAAKLDWIARRASH